MKKLITFSTALLFLLGQLMQPLFARNYDPIISKFVSVDPLMTELTPEQKEHYKRFLYDPQEGNSYNYVLNNPIKYTDPDGLSPCLGLCTLAAIGIAAVVMNPIEMDTKHAEAKANAGMAVDSALMTAPLTKMFSWLKSKFFPASKGVRYGPMNPGPLNSATAATFRSGSYTGKTLDEATTLYRVYGGNANKIGPYWTRTKPSGPLQSQLDSALAPQWKNTAQNVVSIRVPKGTTIFEGAAAPQSTGVGQILGGGNQVYIPRVDPKWIQ